MNQVLKKWATVSLLILLVFNWCGYRFLFNWLSHRADLILENRLNNQSYKEAELIEITVPLDLPYQTDWAKFERVQGEIEWNGSTYKYVERKIVKGKLILRCIPHAAKQLLVSAREAFFKLSNDLQQQPSKKSSSTTIVKIKNVDFNEQKVNLFELLSPYFLTNCSLVDAYRFHLSAVYLGIAERPPALTGI